MLYSVPLDKREKTILIEEDEKVIAVPDCIRYKVSGNLLRSIPETA